jgi:hypothetical protein
MKKSGRSFHPPSLREIIKMLSPTNMERVRNTLALVGIVIM